MLEPQAPPRGERLSPQMYWILVALRRGDNHGYALINVVNELNGGMRYAAGSIYPAIERLLNRGLIEEIADYDHGVPYRRAYRMTSVGQARLAEEVATHEHAAQMGRNALQGP